MNIPSHTPRVVSSSPPHDKRVITTASSGIQPRLLPSNEISNDTLRPHRSRLPLSLYLFSFAPSIRGKPKTSTQTSTQTSTWRQTFSHPYTLYALGTLAALPAGLAFPALDMLYGYWTTGVTDPNASAGQVTGRGSQVGWIMTVVGFCILFLTWAFLACCKYRFPLIRASLIILRPVSTASHHLTEHLRHTYVASVMVQDAAFFEKVGPGEISTRASKDITAIRTAFGEKLGYLIWSLSTIIAVSRLFLSSSMH